MANDINTPRAPNQHREAIVFLKKYNNPGCLEHLREQTHNTFSRILGEQGKWCLHRLAGARYNDEQLSRIGSLLESIERLRTDIHTHNTVNASRNDPFTMSMHDRITRLLHDIRAINIVRDVGWKKELCKRIFSAYHAFLTDLSRNPNYTNLEHTAIGNIALSMQYSATRHTDPHGIDSIENLTNTLSEYTHIHTACVACIEYYTNDDDYLLTDGNTRVLRFLIDYLRDTHKELSDEISNFILHANIAKRVEGHTSTRIPNTITPYNGERYTSEIAANIISKFTGYTIEYEEDKPDLILHKQIGEKLQEYPVGNEDAKLIDIAEYHKWEKEWEKLIQEKPLHPMIYAWKSIRRVFTNYIQNYQRENGCDSGAYYDLTPFNPYIADLMLQWLRCNHYMRDGSNINLPDDLESYYTLPACNAPDILDKLKNLNLQSR